MKVFDLERELATLTGPRTPRVFGSHHVSADCRVGVIRIPAGEVRRSWERHDGGDELLVVVRGRMTFTAELPDGTRGTFDIGPGQAVLIPRGTAHAARVMEDVELLFVTPREGTTVWRDDEPARDYAWDSEESPPT